MQLKLSAIKKISKTNVISNFKVYTKSEITSEQAIHWVNFSVAGNIFSKELNMPLIECGITPKIPSGVFESVWFSQAKWLVVA